MRLEENPQLPMNPDTAYLVALTQFLSRVLKNTAQKVNQIGDGRITGSDFTAASIPTTGMFKQGDVIRNSAPVEAGTAGTKYVVLGWICTVSGSPGTLLPIRALTGN